MCFFSQSSECFTGTVTLDLTLPTVCNTTAFAITLIKADKARFLRAIEIILGMRKLYDCAYQVSVEGEILLAGNAIDDTINIFPTEEVSLVKVVR